MIRTVNYRHKVVIGLPGGVFDSPSKGLEDFMLIVSNIAKRWPGDEAWLFQEVSFTVNPGERVGLVGPNGSGKSTLLQIITGEIQADRGSVQRTPPNIRSGYLAQDLISEPALTIEQMIFPQKKRLDELEDQLATLDADAYDAALTEIIRLTEQMDERAGWQALDDLELNLIPPKTPVSDLSGGQKTRLLLAALTAQRPDLLILDEPTNHLDIDGLTWLERWLNQFDGGLLVVSHDRAFLDRLVTSIVALDDDTLRAEVFPGNYSAYRDYQRQQHAQQWATYKDQQAEIKRLRADVSRTMSKAIKAIPDKR
jgi:ATP-binding cassette, subfamily F, member 3